MDDATATATVEPARSGRGARWSHEPLSEAQRALAAQWSEMAAGHARQWSRTWPRLRDDFAGAAMESLCLAARNFDESKNRSFFTYLKWHLRNARKEVLRAAVPQGFRITGSLRHNPAALARKAPRMLEFDAGKDDRPGGTSESVEALEVREWARHHLAALGEDHARVVRELFWFGRNPTEVAEEMGVDRAEVVRLRDEALAHLRRVDRAEDGGSPLPLPPAPFAAPQEPERMALGPVLAALRARRSMVPADLAARSGLTEPRVLAVEAGSTPTPAEARALAAALGQHPSLVFGLAGLSDPDDDGSDSA